MGFRRGEETSWGEGIRLHVSDPAAMRPVTAGVILLAVLRDLYGNERIWFKENARPEFFDRLCGTDAVRRALLEGESARDITESWRDGLDRFQQQTACARRYRS